MLEILKYLNNKENLILNLEELEYLKLFIKLNVNPENDLKDSLENLGTIYIK